MGDIWSDLGVGAPPVVANQTAAPGDDWTALSNEPPPAPPTLKEQAEAAYYDTEQEEGRALGRGAAGAGEYLLHKAGNVVQSLEAGRGALPAPLRADQSYQPRTAEGKGLVQAGEFGYQHTHPGAYALSQGADVSPELASTADLMEDLALGGITRGDPAYRPGGATYGGPMSSADTNPQSVGAAAAVRSSANASPDLRDAITEARGAGPVNEAVVQRHLQADDQPVPGRLSLGQATRDPAHWTNEFNTRGQIPEGANFFNWQDRNFVDNLREYRQSVIAPDVHTTDVAGHADNIIDAYKNVDKAAEADISAKYKAFADSTGGTIDQSGLLGRLEAQFRKEKIWNQDGTQKVMRSLEDIKANPNMPVDDLEAYQTSLARTARTTSDGHEAYAAGAAKRALYETPVADAATAQQKALAIDARNAARAHFDALDADPAYKAAVGYNVESPGTSIDPARFAQKFIINGGRDQVALMARTLADQPIARQSMGAIGLEHLRSAARVGPQWEGDKFAAQSFNNAWNGLGPKQQLLFGPQGAERLQGFADYVQNARSQPGGGWANYSSTETARLAHEAGGMVAGTAEALANSKIPFSGTVVRKIGGGVLRARRARAFVDEHFSPGAGIDYGTSTP